MKDINEENCLLCLRLARKIKGSKKRRRYGNNSCKTAANLETIFIKKLFYTVFYQPNSFLYAKLM